MQKTDRRKDISDFIFLSKYARSINGRKETWIEAVTRVMSMHWDHFENTLNLPQENLDKLRPYFDFAYESYAEQNVLGAQRALQFGGDQLKKHNMRMYNCTSSYLNRVSFFGELFYILLCGAGAGYSVQKVHIDQLPIVKGLDLTKKPELFEIPDSIEGWSEAADRLIKAHFFGGAPIRFNFDKIRQKGSFISGGFKAPGPTGLKIALEKLNDVLLKAKQRKLRPFEAHRMSCIIADAVISGGIRRSALISIFDVFDDEILKCKSGNWFYTYPELARANNSAAILPSTSYETYQKLFKYAKDFGEPGVLFLKDEQFTLNPCYHKDTLISTISGDAVTIEKLAEQYERTKLNVYVMSARYTDHGWLTEPRPAKVFMSGMKNVIKLVLSNGTELKCTEDHLLAVKDGTYVKAKDSMGNKLITIHNDIVTVEEIQYNQDEVPVYDLTVEGNHNFYANGVLTHNCAEVGMYPQIEDEHKQPSYGWSVCNLSEINGGKTDTKEKFLKAAKAAAILGTFQASYTDFDKHLSPTTKKIVERDALIGVGITGMAENPNICFDAEIQKIGALLVKQTNQEVAELLGINPAVRTTVIKPSGNSSQLLGTSSGIHPFHFQHMIKHIQVTEDEQAANIIGALNPQCIDKSVYGGNVLAFPISVSDDAMLSEDLCALDFLELVKKTQTNWIEYGTNMDHPSYKDNPDLRHNVSNTCTVGPNEWDAVSDYLWENRENFCGISMIGKSGDLDYPQAPFTSYLDEHDLIQTYGPAAILTSGLIMDGLDAFDNNLWAACDTALGRGQVLEITTDKILEAIRSGLTIDGESFKFAAEADGLLVTDTNAVIQLIHERIDRKKDWVRRFKKFAKLYFDNDLVRTSHCLKHTSTFKKWQDLRRMKSVDWSEVEWDEDIIDIDTTGAQACSGGQCEI